MKSYIHTLWESMDPSLSARISISYFSLTPTNSPRILSELLIHVGNLDVSIALRPEDGLSRTLRDILIVLRLFPYISKKIAAFVLLHDSLTTLDFSSFLLFFSIFLKHYHLQILLLYVFHFYQVPYVFLNL